MTSVVAALSGHRPRRPLPDLRRSYGDLDTPCRLFLYTLRKESLQSRIVLTAREQLSFTSTRIRSLPLSPAGLVRKALMHALSSAVLMRCARSAVACDNVCQDPPLPISYEGGAGYCLREAGRGRCHGCLRMIRSPRALFISGARRPYISPFLSSRSGNRVQNFRYLLELHLETVVFGDLDSTSPVTVPMSLPTGIPGCVS